jgi:hypothetical protein
LEWREDEGGHAAASAKHASKVDGGGRDAIDLRDGLILKGNVFARCGLEMLACAWRAERPVTVRVSPERERNRHRVNIDPGPPCHLITVPVEFAMVEAANRDREFVADLAA